jgi:hypothetical protein
MLTCGLVKELYFIVKTLNQPFTMEFFPSKALEGEKIAPLRIEVKPSGTLDIWYRAIHIWNEGLHEDDFFGVESCDTISRIIACINNKDGSWRERYPFGDSKKNLDTLPNVSQAVLHE